MNLHHKIMHHVSRHKEHLIAHVHKHHKKYLVAAGIVSWRAIAKIIAVMLLFLGIAQLDTPIGADYYDTEFRLLQSGHKINISNLGQENEIKTQETRETKEIQAIEEKIKEIRWITGTIDTGLIYPRTQTTWQ